MQTGELTVLAPVFMLAPMSNGEQLRGEAQIQIRKPQRFTAARLLVCSAYGLLLFLPTVLISVLAISFLQLSVLTLALPLLTVAVSTFFLPLGFGNTYVARLAESLRPADRQAMLVQLAFVPRLHWGLRGMVEDADDIGWLSCTEDALVFRGDSVNLAIPLHLVKSVKRENSGLRGLFLYSRTAIAVEGLQEFTKLRFAERSSQILPASWSLGKKLYEFVASKAGQQAG
jgi:hypothetical protein